MTTNEHGYLNQKGNRWFVQHGATTHFNAGFRSLKQFNMWINENWVKLGVEWKNNYEWTLKNKKDKFRLVNKYGKKMKSVGDL